MERIAFIIGQTFIYWSSIIVALGGAVAVCLFLALYLRKSGNWLGAFTLVPLATFASLLLSRLVHWYCRYGSYPGFREAMTDYTSGGYALVGVFAGCLLAAGILRLIRVVKDLPEALDAMALAGAAGIAIGRLSGMFNASNRGMLLESWTQLPIASASVNTVTGQTEYHFATFLFQSIGTGAIFLVLLVFYLLGHRKAGKLRNGDTCLLFLAMYSAIQIPLDSTRYDSLFLRSNGFVSIVQILCAVALVTVIVLFSIRMVRALGWRRRFLVLWLPILALLGGAGYMEYYVQRHGDQAVFAYSVMGGCLLGILLLTLIIRSIAESTRRKAPQTA